MMKLKLLPKTNIEEALSSVRNKQRTDAQCTDSLSTIFNDLDIKIQNNFDFDQLETQKIFHLDQIREVCIHYRLRFLDIKYFKGVLPQSAQEAISKIEKEHNTKLSDFKIMGRVSLKFFYI